jgi:hypothetical protein
VATDGSFQGHPERPPPADLQAEPALIGALLANNRAYDRVSDFLAAEHFADPVHGRIYAAIERRIKAGQLADALTLKAEFEQTGLLDEIGGTAYLAQLLAAMVGVINAGEYGRVIVDTWRRRQLIEHSTAIASAEPDVAGSRWIAEDDQFAIDRTSGQTDVSAAANPLRQQLQIAICNAAVELADVAKRISNTGTWGRLSPTAKILHNLLAADPMTLPNHLGEAYAAMLRLGRFLETDIRVQHDGLSSDDPLDPDIHGLLSDVVQMAAPWLRGFPTVAAWDDESGKALVRADLFQPARNFIRIARTQHVISERDSSEIEMLAEAANIVDYQGQKAGNRAVGSAKNLLLVVAGTVATFLSGSVASDFATRSMLVQRAGATLAAAESEVEAFAATFPNDLRQALRALVKERQSFSNLAIDPARSGPLIPPDIEKQARAMILDGIAPPAAWHPHIQRLDFSRSLLTSLSLLSNLTALRGLSLRNTKASDLSPISQLTTLHSLNLISTPVSDLSALSGLASMRSLYLRGTKVSDLSPLSNLRVLQNLNLINTLVGDLSPLSNLVTLQFLYLMNTHVSDASPLASLTALIALSLRDTKISDVSPLSGLVALQRLCRTSVSDVSPLAGLDALRILDLRDTKVRDLSSLSHLRDLKISTSDDLRGGHKSEIAHRGQ